MALSTYRNLDKNMAEKLSSFINRRTPPAAMYQASVHGTSDNDELSKDDDQR